MARDHPTRPAQSVPAPLPAAWQPLTWRGVAAFAAARLDRLVFIQTVVALLVVAAVVWFLRTGWFPVIRDSIRQLPDTGAIENQELRCPRTSTEPLVDNRLLTFVIAMDRATIPSRGHDIHVEFQRRHVQLCSLLGCYSLAYAPEWNFQFNQPDLQSWWGAWELMFTFWAGLAVFVGLFASWICLATIYCPFLRLYAFFQDRRLTLAGSWRLASATLLPAALLVGVGILLYGLGWIDLLGFLVLWLLHFPLSWVYLCKSPQRLPLTSDASTNAGANPFGTPEPEAEAGTPNPFGGSESDCTVGRDSVEP